MKTSMDDLETGMWISFPSFLWLEVSLSVLRQNEKSVSKKAEREGGEETVEKYCWSIHSPPLIFGWTHWNVISPCTMDVAPKSMRLHQNIHVQLVYWIGIVFTLSFPETLKAVLISESLDEITWCDHSYETSLAVLSHGTIYVKVFYKWFLTCLEFRF